MFGEVTKIHQIFINKCKIKTLTSVMVMHTEVREYQTISVRNNRCMGPVAGAVMAQLREQSLTQLGRQKLQEVDSQQLTHYHPTVEHISIFLSQRRYKPTFLSQSYIFHMRQIERNTRVNPSISQNFKRLPKSQSQN